ncbi:DUF4266 domain-containing protein [Methylomonas sp. LL1]|nr:DUF4266 domain-containing protein [Methylomonas sp. LL1]
MRHLSLALKICLLFGFVGLQGCSSISPWERGNMAKETMGINPTPNLNKFRDHIYSSKEASQGGHSGAGGGCGCN